MPKVKEDKVREERITMEIVVDCYGPEEQAMGWYCYLGETLNFPFRAKCIRKRAISPLKVREEVEVIGMPPAEECEHEMFVMIRWEKRSLAVPLIQLEVVEADDKTREAVKDWHYWINIGYGFG